MNERFEKIMSAASANKQIFDSSIEGVKFSLRKSTSHAKHAYVPVTAKTGWLRGSLSYPWVFICSLVPSLKELF